MALQPPFRRHRLEKVTLDPVHLAYVRIPSNWDSAEAPDPDVVRSCTFLTVTSMLTPTTSLASPNSGLNDCWNRPPHRREGRWPSPG